MRIIYSAIINFFAGQIVKWNSYEKGYCLKAACINIEAKVRLVPDAEHDALLLQSFKPWCLGGYQFFTQSYLSMTCRTNQ